MKIERKQVMNSKFNGQRFLNTLKLDIATNWRRFSKIFFGALACFLCTFLIFTFAQRGSVSLKDFSAGIFAMCLMSYFITASFMAISGVYIFNNMKTKQDRISFLVLPASNLEKFLSRYLMATVGMLLTILAALLVADLVRMAFGLFLGITSFDSIFLKFFGFGWISISEYQTVFLAYSTKDIISLVWMFFAVISIIVSCHAEFMLGGSLFRKNPLLLTIISLFVINSLLASIVPGRFFVSMLFGMNHNPDSMALFQASRLLWIVIVPNIVVTLLCYWGSYKLFCRSQVISNKWINL